MSSNMGMPLPSPSRLTQNQVRVRSVLAFAGVVGAWSAIALLIYANLNKSVVDSPTGFNALAVLAFILSCLLWVMMWFEFVRERPADHTYLWAFLLMTGPVVGPLLFYYRIWRMRVATLR